MPREKKIASSWTILAVIRRILLRGRILAAKNQGSQNQLRRIHERGMTLSSVRFRPSCTSPNPTRSKATPVTMESPHSDPCSRRAPHSQPNTTTSPVSRSPATRSLQQSSAVPRCREIQPRLPNLQPNVSGADHGEAAVGDRLSEQNQFPSSFAIRTMSSTITRMPRSSKSTSASS